MFLNSRRRVASRPHLAVLLQQDHSAVVNLKLAVVLETPHLKNKDRCRRQCYEVMLQLKVKGQMSHLDVEALWRLHVLRDVQTLIAPQRAHEGGQRLLILTEPLQLKHTHLSADLPHTHTQKSYSTLCCLFHNKSPP